MLCVGLAVGELLGAHVPQSAGQSSKSSFASQYAAMLANLLVVGSAVGTAGGCMNTVGPSDGTALGSSDGPAVGSMVGSGVGRIDGTSDGGIVVGELLGRGVVGAWVGWSVPPVQVNGHLSAIRACCSSVPDVQLKNAQNAGSDCRLARRPGPSPKIAP